MLQLLEIFTTGVKSIIFASEMCISVFKVKSSFNKNCSRKLQVQKPTGLLLNLYTIQQYHTLITLTHVIKRPVSSVGDTCTCNKVL